MARVDTVLLAASPDSLAPLVLSLRSALLTERASSDSAIASLSSALDAKNLALSASDSVIASLRSQIAASAELAETLQRQAHPSFLRRALRFGQAAAVGSLVTVVLLAL